MRRIFLTIFVSILSAITVCAQEADSLHLKSSSISVDSLVLKLNTLQHNYDFLYCDYELHKAISDIAELSSSINIASNSLMIYYYNSRFDRDLYASYLGLYNAKVETFNSLKESVGVTTVAVLSRMLTSNFTEKEMAVIEKRFEFINSLLSTAEKTINHFEVVLDTYRAAK